jgi:hypothetical protein
MTKPPQPRRTALPKLGLPAGIPPPTVAITTPDVATNTVAITPVATIPVAETTRPVATTRRPPGRPARPKADLYHAAQAAIEAQTTWRSFALQYHAYRSLSRQEIQELQAKFPHRNRRST